MTKTRGPDLLQPVAVAPREGFRIWLRYADGVEGEVDLSDMAGKGVFAAWLKPGFFDRVRISEWGSVTWDDEIELCPDALYLEITGKSFEDIMPGLRDRRVAPEVAR